MEGADPTSSDARGQPALPHPTIWVGGPFPPIKLCVGPPFYAIVSNLRFRHREWPLLWIEVVGAPSIEGTMDFCAEVDRWLARDRPFASIVDVTQTQVPDAHNRKVMAEYMARKKAELTRLVVADATVVSWPCAQPRSPLACPWAG